MIIAFMVQFMYAMHAVTISRLSPPTSGLLWEETAWKLLYALHTQIGLRKHGKQGVSVKHLYIISVRELQV